MIYGIDFEDYKHDKAKAEFHAVAQFLKPGSKAFLSCHHQISTFEMDATKGLLYVESIQIEPVSQIEEGYVRQNEPGSFFK